MPASEKPSKQSVFDAVGEKTHGFASKSLILVVVFGIVVIAALGSAIYFYLQYQKTQDQLKSPTAAAAKESAALVDEVGKLIALPQNESPQIATVTDINKLKEQSFFSQAKNGDKVLIYTKAAKAILYDPIQKKVIEVGPINLAQATSTPAVSPTPGIVKAVLYNGTTTTGLTNRTEKALKTSLPTVLVTDKSNANKSNYTQTLIVDISGKHAADAAQLAKVLGGTVGTLPAGEVKPVDADLVVILGK